MSTFVFATDVPNVLPSTSSWELVSNSRMFRSPLTNAIQTAARKGSHWKISLAFNNLSGEDRANLQAFLTKLEGQEHRFSIIDHSFVRRGSGVDTGLVTAASSGNTLNFTRSLSSSISITKVTILAPTDSCLCVRLQWPRLLPRQGLVWAFLQPLGIHQLAK